MNRLFIVALLGVTAGATACGPKVQYIPGSRIPYSELNKSVIDAVEEYRLAVERQDAEALMLMAHKQYWEDSGTPSGSDDYGYEGLRTVLQTRFQQASDIRYTVRYMKVAQQCKDELVAGCKATVDVLIDASYTIPNVQGKPTRPDMRDQNQFVLEWDGRRWLFLSGM
jgi:hypothetical protein